MIKQSGKWPFIFLSCALAALFFASACAKKSTEMSLVERGKYLTNSGGCGDCHSPKMLTESGPVPDPKRLLSGYPAGAKLPEIPKSIFGPAQWGAITTNDMTAWVGVWGVSYSYNLTPDPRTGIGNWDDTMFVQSLRTGKFMGTSRDMLPPMPWQSIAQLSDYDLKAMLAYLKTLPPVENEIPEPVPPSQ